MKTDFYKLYLVVLCTMIGQVIYAQERIVIANDDFIDAAISKDRRPGNESIADSNFDTHPRISAVAWSNSGSNLFWRSLFYFNLQDIPSGSTIQSAYLYLNSNPTVTDPNVADGNSQRSGSNAFYLEKITQEWDEGSVTWNNQPLTSSTDRVRVGPSTSVTENLQIDLSLIVQQWINDPVSNNGLKMVLENEVFYRSRNYASTDHFNTSIRPKLVIMFTPPSGQAECATPDISEEDLMALPWYGNETFLENYNDSLEQVYGKPAARVPGDVESPWLRIPIQFWIYQISAGNPGGVAGNFPNERRLQLMMDDLNNASKNNGLKFRFYLENLNFVNSEGSLHLGTGEQLSLANSNRNNSAVNVHIVDDISAAPGVYNPLCNAIFIERGIGLNEGRAGTFTHEVGHFFGLMHTHIFYGVPCFREPVTRGRRFTPCPNGPGYTRRCNFTGDLLCDTEADPRMNEDGYDGATCTWDANGERDQNGDLYHPDPRNYMAYANVGFVPPCRTRFSTSQKHVARFGAFSRQYRSSWRLSGNNQFDRFEPDDGDIAAREIMIGQPQTHTFHSSGRVDNVDWLEFNYPGSIYNYQVVVTQTAPSATAPIEIFIEQGNGVAGARLAGVATTTVGNVITYTIPCTLLSIGRNYLIRIPRNGAGPQEYDVELKRDMIAPIAVSGPPSVCYSNVTYTAQNVPPGGAITWTQSPNVIYVSGQGTSSYTVRANSAGIGHVQFTVRNACTTSNPIRKDVSLDAPTPVIYGPQAVNDHTNVEYYTIIPAINYEWAVINGIITSGQGTSRIGVKADCVSEGEMTVSLRIITNCGTSPWNLISAECFPEEGHLVNSIVFPNPVDETLTIQTEKSGTKEIIIRDTYRVVKQVTTTETKLDVDVKDMPGGIYYLIINEGQNKRTQRIVIK